jgi:Skp family chaperone for outer membrane proteins
MPVVRKTTLSQQGVLNVRTSLQFATSVASLLCVLFAVQSSMAQVTAPPNAPRGYGQSVVVIDIGHIFRHHARFKMLMDDLKADLEVVEKSFREKSAQVQTMVERLKQYNPGSPEYNRLEEDITRAQANIQAEMALKKKEFMLKEAGIYSQVYNEIVGVVSRYCERNGVSLVLRYSSDEIDPQTPNSVMKGINRNIVYQHNRNITYDILAEMNPQTRPATPTTTGQRQDPNRHTNRNFRPTR